MAHLWRDGWKNSLSEVEQIPKTPEEAEAWLRHELYQPANPHTVAGHHGRQHDEANEGRLFYLDPHDFG